RASVRPSGENARAFTPNEVAGTVPRGSPVVASSSSTTGLWNPATARSRSLGENASATVVHPAERVVSTLGWHVDPMSHSFTTPPASPDARRHPSALNVTALTPPSCPPRSARRRPARQSQSVRPPPY